MTSIRERNSWPEIQPTLSDGVIDLRPWRSEDANWVYAACQDPAIQRWTSVRVPYELEDAEGFVGALSPINWLNELGAHFAVVDTASGGGLGSIGMRVQDLPSGVGEAGYWTAPEARGVGVTTRALKLLTDWALNSAGMVRLELLIEVENLRSRAVAERTGYLCEAKMSKKVYRHGAHRDILLYARTV